MAEAGVQLVVASVQASIDAGRVREQTGPRASRNPLQTVTLLDTKTIFEDQLESVERASAGGPRPAGSSPAAIRP